VAAAYGIVLIVVLAYVAIIAAKLARLQRQLSELVELAKRRPPRVEVEAARESLRARLPDRPGAGLC
jgi:hypothetical protein